MGKAPSKIFHWVNRDEPDREDTTINYSNDNEDPAGSSPAASPAEEENNAEPSGEDLPVSERPASPSVKRRYSEICSSAEENVVSSAEDAVKAAKRRRSSRLTLLNLKRQQDDNTMVVPTEVITKRKTRKRKTKGKTTLSKMAAKKKRRQRATARQMKFQKRNFAVSSTEEAVKVSKGVSL